MRDHYDLDELVPVDRTETMKIMIKHMGRQAARFLDFLEGEGLTVCRGAMPLSKEAILERFREHEYQRRGLNQAAPASSSS